MVEIWGWAVGNDSMNEVLLLTGGWWGFIALSLIYTCSGFLGGVTGSGFTTIGVLAVWILPPHVAIPMLMALSMASQLMSMQKLKVSLGNMKIWSHGGPAPYILGGLFGIPVGLWILHQMSSTVLCAVVGTLLVFYSTWSLFKPDGIKLQSGGIKLSIVVGFVGGVIGGSTAFPSIAVVIWAGLLGMNKEAQRGVVQPFILFMQATSLILLIASENMGSGQIFNKLFFILFLIMALMALPFTVLGVATYRKMSDVDFKKATHGLMSVSGSGLIFKGFASILSMLLKAKFLTIAALAYFGVY